MSEPITIPVYFNAEGEAINFGEWVYFYNTDLDGNKTVINPIPDGVVKRDTLVVVNPDGSRIIASN
jgi:signal transduction histidine kinase